MKELRIVCSGPPDTFGKSGEFIEAEDETGKSINAGEWRERKDGLWELVVVVDTLR
jgi:hypothetical protein